MANKEISVGQLDVLVHPGFCQIGNHCKIQPDSYQALFQLWDSKARVIAGKENACLLYLSSLTEPQIDVARRGEGIPQKGIMEEVLRISRYQRELGARMVLLGTAKPEFYLAGNLKGVVRQHGWRIDDKTRLEVYGEIAELCVVSLGKWVQISLNIADDHLRINRPLSLSVSQIAFREDSHQLWAHSRSINVARALGNVSMRAIRFIGNR